jgi:GNAT superfamily N-acetyltransferase
MMRRTEELVAGLGFRLRMAGMEDIDALVELRRRTRSPRVAPLVSPYCLFRVIHHGRPLVLEDGQGSVRAYCLEQSYIDGTSFCISLTVDADVAGHKLGAALVRYSALLAWQAGATAQRAIIGTTNHASLTTFLNHVGHVAVSYYPDLPGYESAYLATYGPVRPSDLANSTIDQERLQELIRSGTAGKDYQLLIGDDREALQQVYHGRSFKIAAVVRENRPMLLALPETILRADRAADMEKV